MLESILLMIVKISATIFVAGSMFLLLILFGFAVKGLIDEAIKK